MCLLHTGTVGFPRLEFTCLYYYYLPTTTRLSSATYPDKFFFPGDGFIEDFPGFAFGTSPLCCFTTPPP